MSRVSMLAKVSMMCVVANVLVAAAAFASDGTTPRERAIAPPTRIPEPVGATALPAGTPVSTSAMPREVRRAVVADAARRFKVDESSVVLTRAEQVTWPDGSLGCAEPGQMYTQMLVEGYRVSARTTEGELVYHTDGRGHVVNCPATFSRPKPGEKREGVTPRSGQPPQTPDR